MIRLARRTPFVHLVAALLLAGVLAGCGGTSGVPSPDSPQRPGEGPVDGTQTVAFQSSSIATFTLQNTGSSALAWNFEVENAASNPQQGAWFEPQPASGTLAAGASVPVTLTLEGGLEPGTYRSTLLVVYEGGRTAFEVTGVVDGNSPPAGDAGFSLSATPSSLELAPGGTTRTTVAVDFRDGVAENVSVEVPSPPAGLATQLSFAGGTSVYLDLSATVEVAPGSYVVTVVAIGQESGARAELPIPVTVESAGDGGGGGTARIAGEVTTANADVPLTGAAYPGSFATAQRLSAHSPTPDEPAYAPGQLLVAWHDPTDAPADGGALQTLAGTARDVLAPLGLRPLEPAAPGQAQLVAVPAGEDAAALAARLERDPRVRWAEPNVLFHRLDLPGDPDLDLEWHLPIAGVPLGWQARQSAGITVAVLDSAFDLAHPDLQGVFHPGYDFCANRECTQRDADPGVRDGYFDTHGTHVAGLLAAVGDNGRGVAGVVPGGGRRVVPVKVFPDDTFGSATAGSIADAIRWAAGLSVAGVPRNDHPAKIINLSLGAVQDSNAVREAVRDARAAGALVVAAVGNSGTSQNQYPAAYEGVLGVGAVNSRLERSCFSNTSNVDLVAPGGDGFLCDAPRDEALWSTFAGGDYGYDAGTSMATPIVSGVAALVWETRPRLTATELQELLKSRAYLPAGAGQGMGAGVVRLDTALGFPGPGQTATVAARGESAQARDTVTLDPYGGSSRFELTDLPSGSVTVEASASGTSRSLTGETSVSAVGGDTRSTTLQLR